MTPGMREIPTPPRSYRFQFASGSASEVSAMLQQLTPFGWKTVIERKSSTVTPGMVSTHDLAARAAQRALVDHLSEEERRKTIHELNERNAR